VLLAEGRELFLQSLQHAEGRSINTIIGYRSLLKRYERYLAVQGLPTWVEQQNASLLHGYLGAMGTAGNKHSTIDHAYTVLSSFFAWAVRAELLHRNPARAFRRKRAARPLPRAVDPALVLGQIETMKRTRFRCIDSRDRVAVMIMLFSGARVSEACALTWGDIEWERGLLSIPQTKGGEADHRLVPLSSALREELIRHRAAVSATFPDC
jgi:integrase/recombinase XerC